MICHDFRCQKCQSSFEVIFPSRHEYSPELPCEKCGGSMIHVWKTFGARGRVGGEKGRYPRYEIQAGRTFHSAREEKAYLKEKGLERQGPDEYRRSLSAPGQSEPDYSGLRECMKEAYEETIVKGQVVPHKVVGSDFKWIDSKEGGN